MGLTKPVFTVISFNDVLPQVNFNRGEYEIDMDLGIPCCIRLVNFLVVCFCCQRSMMNNCKGLKLNPSVHRIANTLPFHGNR
jgi:hypothetical protein